MKGSAPTVVSLFSGAGGMDLGFKAAGFEIIWANDNFVEATETYRLNIGSEIVYGDIENINISTIPRPDVVIGGFPCQGFSVANTKRSADDRRNVLYKYFVEVVRSTQPAMFVAENVKGILSIDDGRAIRRIVDEFAEEGYSVEYKLFNACHFGVPQSRERVIILGIRKDTCLEVQFPPSPTHAVNGLGGKHKVVTIGEALKDIPNPDDPHSLLNHVYTKYKSKYNGYISNRPVDPEKPAPTVTARGDARGGAMIMNHPLYGRRLSCRELAVLQGFPMGFQFCGCMTAVYRQIANAVPPPFAASIAGSLRAAFESKDHGIPEKGLRARPRQTFLWS